MLVAAVAGAAGVAKLVQDNKVGRRNFKSMLKPHGFRAGNLYMTFKDKPAFENTLY
jgi:hypothetical protein